MKIGLLSLGCPKNLVDSEVMLGLAEGAGHTVTADAADADVLVVNTCAFIDRAKQESVDAILEMARQKQSGRCQRLIVTGCLAERYRSELAAEIPEIDAVLGTGEVEEIVRAIDGGSHPSMPASAAGAPVNLFRHRPSAEAAAARLQPPLDARTAGASTVRGLAARHRDLELDRELPTYLYDATTPRHLTTPPHYAYVKLAEGCDYNCAFCIIPALRGPYRSRQAASIVEEARRLADRGVKELLLISQDSTFFGVDRKERGALARLLRELDAVNGLLRVRLLYLYPTTITDDVLDVMATSQRICRYIDLPLQHSAPSVLRRMRRPGDGTSYRRLLDRMRDRVPGVTLRTTFIVGFPGETAAEFDDLCAFVEDVGFDHVGVFTYSHEEGTAAFGLADDVPAAEKRRRLGRIMARQQRIVRRRHRQLLGSEATVLVDGPSPEHELVVQGRLEGQAPDIDSVVYLTDCDPSAWRAGDVVRVEIVGAEGYDLLARPLAAADEMCYANVLESRE